MKTIDNATFLKMRALAFAVDSNLAAIDANAGTAVADAQMLSWMLVELFQEIESNAKKGG